jgi:phospholipid transport system transporter-binding protein
LSDSNDLTASFELLAGGRAQVHGSLNFRTVTGLLPTGVTAISAGQAAVIDLGGITGSDSSGLALLIEWLSMAKKSAHSLTYENMPQQLQQLARLSDVEALLTPVTPTIVAA